MSLRVVTVGPADRAAFAEGIAALERGTSYPLGDDRFELDHGVDYFAFFDRLGEAVYEVALDGERVVAISCRVLRERPLRCWYLCDLKVHPDYRGQRIAQRFVRHAFVRAYARCSRGYAISMNEAGGAENRIERLVRRLRMVPIGTAELALYSLACDDMARCAPIVERHRGPVAYLSHAGRKDLLLHSTGQRLPLLHAQFGRCAADSSEAGWTSGPQEDHVHMLVTPRGDGLDAELRASGCEPDASATLIHHRMKGGPFDFVLTSDI